VPEHNPIAGELDPRWEVRREPPLLTRRFEFPAYAATRKFLDQLADLSRRTGLYPDLNFAKTHVNVTFSGSVLGEPQLAFAREVDALWNATSPEPGS
jgi:pterin-4a-carbinolamine dehydratase